MTKEASKGTFHITAARKRQFFVMQEFLDSVEDGFLHEKKAERSMLKYVKNKKLIDISSASSMNILTYGMPMSFKLDCLKVLKTIEQYPYLVAQEHSLDGVFKKFLKKWVKEEVKEQEIAIFSGVYGAMRTLTLCHPGKYVLVPHFIHQTHKACFSVLGKEVKELPLVAPTKRMDLKVAEAFLKKNKGQVAFWYIYHARPAHLDKKYWIDISRLLKKYHVTALIDFDVIYTNHFSNVDPVLPFRIATLRQTSIFLFNLTKEVGIPGIRIGFGVAREEIVQMIQKFQQLSFEMIPPVTKYIAQEVLQCVNLQKTKTELQGRMGDLVTGLQSLGFVVHEPLQGVNLFLHVPNDFVKVAEENNILPDQLFTFFLLKKAHVIVRPASVHGFEFNHYVRFVICQNREVIQEVLNRLREINISPQTECPSSILTEYQNVFCKSV